MHMVRERYLTPSILEDLKEKMVFLGGPRQVGKTTLAVDIIGPHFASRAFNWDKLSERKAALKGEWPGDCNLIILDEFHKSKKWRSWIKGEYDTQKSRLRFMLTGSARMNVYRKGGDSLQGRYHYFRLHPFSVAEILSLKPPGIPFQPLQFAEKGNWDDLEALFQFGGFPDPFLRQNGRHWRRWGQERLERFFREDVRDLTQIQDMANLNLLADLLPERVGSVLSINSLAEDLQVNFRTVARWLDIFEELFYCFRIPPYRSRKIASVKKEKKLYLWDWSQVKDEGARWENLVASHLLKFCHYLADVEGYRAELYYLRDVTKRETDFLVTMDQRPWFAVEVKKSAEPPSPALFYFKERLAVPFSYQVAARTDKNCLNKGIHLLPASLFLTALV
ncbi:MAG: ATP-binding protein [Deltaproteobacteria bacterium]|nr:ATP-binding protein [Deltaproteobacteria bacterium]